MTKVKQLRQQTALRVDVHARPAGSAGFPALAKAKERAKERDNERAKQRSSKERASGAPQHLPVLARTETLDKATRTRFEEEIDAALKRRPTSEAKLAGPIRALAVLSPSLRAALGEATGVLIRRGSYQRELYVCGLRSLSEAEDRQAVPLLRQALSGEQAGGSAALSAACFSRDPELLPLLAKIAASRQSHLAFGAELARVVRGESNGALLAQVAPMIKESHRISMCLELFVPLTRRRSVAVHVAPALSMLRGAERHLGRWLVLAEVAVRAGDRTPLQEAQTRATSGPSSSRPAWTLVAWALAEADAAVRGAAPPSPPATRPTLELIARLSDRPSADRDTTFLFRLARSGSAAARPMLETLVRTRPLSEESSIRAALYLTLGGDRDDLREALVEVAAGGKREDLRGMAAAALWDACPPESGEYAATMRARARDIAEDLAGSRLLANLAWSGLIRAAARGALGADRLLAETSVRWIQAGWLE